MVGVSSYQDPNQKSLLIRLNVVETELQMVTERYSSAEYDKSLFSHPMQAHIVGAKVVSNSSGGVQVCLECE